MNVKVKEKKEFLAKKQTRIEVNSLKIQRDIPGTIIEFGDILVYSNDKRTVRDGDLIFLKKDNDYSLGIYRIKGDQKIMVQLPPDSLDVTRLSEKDNYYKVTEIYKDAENAYSLADIM